MNIIIVGGKGNGTVVLATILDIKQTYKKDYDFIGFVNDDYDSIKEIDGFPVIGRFSDIEKLCYENNAFFINAITSIKTIAELEEKYLNVFPKYEEKLISIIHPSSFLGYNLKIGRGVFVGPQNYIGQNAEIGNLAFIHSQCYIARDTKIGEFSYLAPKVYLGAETVVGRMVYFGINSLVKERLNIEDHSVLGMGAVIVKDTEKHGLYYGERAKKRN